MRGRRERSAARVIGALCLAGLATFGLRASVSAPPPAGFHSGDRAALLEQREGFGRHAGTGSLDWPAVLVTSLKDSGDGTLREALEHGGRWIRFGPALRGEVRLRTPLEVPNDVVIDGRGADVTLHAGPRTVILLIADVDNVIVTNLKLVGGEDAIQLFQGTTDVWLHQVTAQAAADEILSATGDGRRPDRITVSWSRFEHGGKVMLLGASEEQRSAAPDRVTLHHNVFAYSRDRQPLVRFARVHFYNNHLIGWGSDGTGQAVRVGAGGQFASESNVFDDLHGRPAIIPEDLGTLGRVRSSGDVTTGRTTIVERHAEQVFRPRDHYTYRLDRPGDALRGTLEDAAGWQLTY